ncbi:MAG: hypothetical protein U5L46_14230 [Agrobacterium sp.]|nr:hypothetical protein [Agrobacterium sp.]
MEKTGFRLKRRALETVVPPDVSNQPTGLCFREQMSAAIRTAVQEFVGNAARFSSERFRRELADTVNFALAERI